MNGALSDPDREAIAVELGEIREQLLEAANMQVDGNYSSAARARTCRPWEELQLGGLRRVVYRGNRDEQTIQVGLDTQIAISAAGDRVFGRAVPARRASTDSPACAAASRPTRARATRT
jgi:flagellar hook-associated protein 3 FlgL